MARLMRTLVVFAGVLMLLSCHSKPHKTDDQPAAKRLPERIERQNFNLDVFNASFSTEIAKNPDSNVLIAPTSIKLALGLLLLGAEGETDALIRDVLGFPDVQKEEAAKALKELSSKLQASSKQDSKIEFNIANGLFLTGRSQVKKTYLKQALSFFDARPMKVRSVEPINQWVSKKTKGRIPKILDSLDVNSIIVLTNALYFKGSWQKVYKKGKGSFTTSAHKTLTNIEFAENEAGETFEEYGVVKSGNHEYAVLKKKYVRASGAPALSMYFILPPEGVSANYVATQTIGSPAFWAQVDENVVETQLNAVRFPIVELGSNIDLKSAFMKMKSASGQPLGQIFQIADLKGISDEADYVGQAKHRTFMRIDEKGTEAAAATAITIVRAAIMDHPSFIVDRPYMIALRDDDRGEFIFLGVVNDPTAK